MDEYVSMSVCNERRCHFDERYERDREAIEKIDANLANLTEIITRIAALQETGASTQAEHEKRIRTLEQAPAGKWDKLTTTIVTAIASGLVGYALSGLIK